MTAERYSPEEDVEAVQEMNARWGDHMEIKYLIHFAIGNRCRAKFWGNCITR
jgi:hypothetical protein